MTGGKTREFVTVLFFALAFGAAVTAVMEYVEDPSTRTVMLIALGGLAILSWQYLRRRFDRR